MQTTDFVKKLKDGQGDKTLIDYAKALGIDRVTLWRLMTKKTKPSIETYLKVVENKG